MHYATGGHTGWIRLAGGGGGGNWGGAGHAGSISSWSASAWLRYLLRTVTRHSSRSRRRYCREKRNLAINVGLADSGGWEKSDVTAVNSATVGSLWVMWCPRWTSVTFLSPVLQVTGVVGRAELLSSVFFLAAFLAYARAATARRSTGKR